MLEICNITQQQQQNAKIFGIYNTFRTLSESGLNRFSLKKLQLQKKRVISEEPISD